MDELQRWADSAPTNRAFTVERLRQNPAAYKVTVDELPGLRAIGQGPSIVFAAVRALDELSRKMGEG